MALVTGGLGGLGVLATYELAAAGAPFVVTTSRSGRIAAGQRELVQLQENLRQMTEHYSARIDGTDMAALVDLFQYIQRPDAATTEDFDVFTACINSLEKNPDLLGEGELQKLQSTRDHMQATCEMLQREIEAKRGTSREEWLLRETQKKMQRMDEVMKRSRSALGNAPASEAAFVSSASSSGASPPSSPPLGAGGGGEAAGGAGKKATTLKEYLARQARAQESQQATSVLDQVEHEVSAARASADAPAAATGCDGSPAAAAAQRQALDEAY